MSIARIFVLAIALAAGGVAAYLASGIDKQPTPVAPVVAQLQTVDVLVAKSEISLGQTLTPNDMIWQSWPASTASGTFIRRSDRPDATNQFAGSIARAPFVAGEPIREAKLVKADGSGFMAAILSSGYRAVATEVTAESSAGGFVLPNDRVDVILTRRIKNPNPTQPDIVISQVALANVRVLAVDQTPKEKEGTNSVIARTVTLELKPEQTTDLASARQAGTLSLALRSIADANQIVITNNETQRPGINVVRYGVNNPGAAAAK
jgi:pilus assembly protein CpaB